MVGYRHFMDNLKSVEKMDGDLLKLEKEVNALKKEVNEMKELIRSLLQVLMDNAESDDDDLYEYN